MVICIFVTVNDSFLSLYIIYSTSGSVCPSTVTCQWRCDRTAEYHQIKKQQFEIFSNCSKLYLRFYDRIFGGCITIKITFASFKAIHHFERTILKIRVLYILQFWPFSFTIFGVFIAAIKRVKFLENSCLESLIFNNTL